MFNFVFQEYRRRMKKIFLLFLIIFIAQINDTQAQNRKKRLEAKRLELQREINQINRQLQKVKRTQHNALEFLSQINRKIKIRKQLISSLRKEINLLSQKINNTDKQILSLEKDLEILKKNYAEMIRQSYKSRSRNSKIYFLLSAEDFQQAFKRMQYLKQYANYRKSQVKEIEQKKKALEILKKDLEKSKKEKQKLFQNYKKEQELIVQEQKTQQQEVEKIKNKSAFYIAQIRKKEREKRKIDKLIEAEIKKAIARSNRNRKTKGKHYISSKSKFFMTPEAKKLADEFSRNRGLLPWPVKKAYISRHYGKQPHEIYKKVMVINSGVNLATEKDSKVYAVFKGKVLQIQIIPGGNTTVMIKHGNYLSVYQNLKVVYVKPGDFVKTKQPIGVVATDPTTGKTELKFLIYKNLTKLNPENWLLKK